MATVKLIIAELRKEKGIGQQELAAKNKIRHLLY